MTGNEEMHTWVEDADSLAEFIEIAERNDVPEHIQASQLLQQIWERDVPQDRVLNILHRERERLADYQSVTFSETSRAPRYMDLTDLELVSGYEFEYVLAEMLRRVDGDATVTEGSGDQGVDVVWFRENTTVGIQAKAYDIKNPVGNSAVQEIHTGSVVRQSEYSIDIPAVVTTSRYTESAKEAAENSAVTLYDRSDLKQWLSDAELDAEAMGDLLDSI
jgi:HJR/Mrr/RecB family endonuclease